MKHTLKYMIVALAGLSLLACNKKEEIVPDEKPAGKYTYTIAVAGDTKSHISGDHMTWDDGDMIGWFINNNAFDCSEIDEEATPCTFEVSSATALPANSMVYAFAPCYSLYYESTPTKTAAPLSIPVSQSGTISDAMPMVSVPIEIADPVAASTDKPIAEAKFINLGAVIEYNIYTTNASYNAEKVQSVTFTSGSNIAGDFTVNLTTVAENNIPAPSGLTEKEVTSTLATATTVGASKAAGIKVYQVVAPGSYTGTVTVATDKAIYRYTFNEAKTFGRATIKVLNADLNRGVRTPNPYEHWFSEGDFDITTAENYVTIHEDTFDGITWTLNFVSCNGGDRMFQWTGSEGWARNAIQCGYNNGGATREVTLSTDGFPGVITKLAVYYLINDDQDDVTASATVGGSAFGTSVAHVNEAWKAEFTGSATGEIVLRITATTTRFPVRIKGMYVEYDPDGQVTPTPDPDPTVEELLTANQWVLSSVVRAGTDVTQTAGNKITFNANHSFTFDCTANSGKVWDYYYEGGVVDPDWSNWNEGSYWEGYTLEWSVSNSGNTNNLNFTTRAYPLVVVDNVINFAMSYEILTLTESSLVLHHDGDGGNFTITFSAAPI